MKTFIAAGALVIAGAALAGWTTASTEHTTENTHAATATTAAAGTFTVDGIHSAVLFKVRHAGAANFYGRFNEITGTLTEANGRITGADVTVAVNSVDTNHSGRDDHLKNADFFNGRQYPEITFKSTGTTADTITGELTLHGVTKTVTADIVDVGSGSMRGKEKLGAEFHFTIKRSDYDVRGYLADDLSDDGPIGNTVHLIVAIEADG